MATADVTKIQTSNNSLFKEVKEKAFAAMALLQDQAASMVEAATYDDHWSNSIDVPDVAIPTKLDINSLPTISEIMGSIGNITADPFPVAPTSDELQKYKKHVWESSQLDSIQAAVMDYISSMGMPDTIYQNAIFDAGKERLNRTLADQIDLIAAKTSADGFKYANGQTNALIEKLITDNQDAKIDQSRKIEELMTNWAKDNLQFAIQQGTAIEAAHMDFTYKYSSIFRELYMTLITSVLEKYRTQVQMAMSQLDAKIKAVISRADLLKTNAAIVSDDNRAKLERARIEIDQAVAIFRETNQFIINQSQHQITAAQSLASTSGSLVQGVTSSVIGVMKG